MNAESTTTHLRERIEGSPVVDWGKAAAFLALTKPRVTAMVVLTTLAGFYLASTSAIDLVLLFHTLAGTALIAGGTAGLNQCLERVADSRMRRTQGRPLPSGRLGRKAAYLFGMTLVTAGAVYLAAGVNPLTALLGIVTTILYLFLYTPLKTRSALCTSVGAIPGAMPPLMGWVAVRNELDLTGFTLFAILFFWQFPHFMAIAWKYRDDYEKGGFLMLPVVDREGRRTVRQVIVGTLALIAFSLLPTWLGLSGGIYLAGAFLLGLMLLFRGFEFARSRNGDSALTLMRATLIYLPLLLLLMSFDKLPG